MTESIEKPEAKTGSGIPVPKARWRDHDHTQGSLLRSLGLLALPMVGSSLVGGVLFQLVDLKLISELGDQGMTAVVITNQSMRQIYMVLLMGASFGAQGLIARSIGSSDQERADHIAGQTLLMGTFLSVVAAVIGLIFARDLLSLMNVSEEVLKMGVPYVRWVFGLNFGFVFVILFGSLLAGAGDSSTPFIITIAQTGISLVAEWMLIGGHLGAPDLGIRGVAIGLGVGQLVAIGLAGRVLFSGRTRVHVRARHMRPDWAAMRSILSLSWPPAFQMLGGFLVTVFFIRLMGDFGGRAQTAYSIGLRLGMIAPMVCFPLAGAVATLVGQNLGARNIPRAWCAMGVGILVHGGVMWSLALALFFFREPFLRLFTHDPEVIEIGSRMLMWQAGQFALLAFLFVFMRALQGAGDVIVPMGMSLASALLVAIPLGLYLSEDYGMGPDGLFIAQFASTALSTVINGAYVATGRWTRMGSLKQTPAA